MLHADKNYLLHTASSVEMLHIWHRASAPLNCTIFCHHWHDGHASL